jgi:hypothetical protein
MSPSLPPSIEQVLAALKQAVDKELERKRLLGHYTVTWQDGQAVLQGPDTPQPQP